MTASLFHRISSAAAFFPGKFAAVLLIALAALFCAATPASASTSGIIANGANAVDILGQFSSPSVDTTDYYTKGCPNNGASSLGFNNPTYMTIDATNHWLFVSDSGNNRVLVFPLTTGNLISSKTPSYVLGQADFIHCAANQGGSASISSLSNPQGVAIDPTNQYLYVGDKSNNRVMIFSTSSMANGENASYEFGQASGGTAFTSTSTGTTQSKLNAPVGVALFIGASLLYVADSANNRVQEFSTSGLANGENATYYLGSGSAGDTASTLDDPTDVAIDPLYSQVYVSDYANCRVLMFPSSYTDDVNADGVAGQSGYTTNTCATTQSGLGYTSGSNIGPTALAIDAESGDIPNNSRIFIVDTGNNRVMIGGDGFSSGGATMSNVLGQSSFTARSSATTQSGLNSPGGVAYDSTNDLLYVSDSANNRVLLFNLKLISSTSQGDQDACAITVGGALYCWGANGYGQAGLGNTTSYTTPQQVTSPSETWSSVSNGYYDTCAITTAGALYCWGYNYAGEDGVGNTTQHTSPQHVTSPSTTWSTVSMGEADACAITTAGKLYCWGQNGEGEDGVGNTTENNSPVQVGTATNWSSVSQSGSDACAINTSGALYCWGLNGAGEDGLGNTTAYHTPQQVTAISGTWTAVSTNGQDTCGINGGALYCWGYNSNGEDGLGNTTEYNSPQQVGTATNWTSVSTNTTDGTGHALDTCAVNSSGALYCWGSNANGEDGLANTTSYHTPQQVVIGPVATTWTAVSQSGMDACGINQGALYCWGYNEYGEDGTGDTAQIEAPAHVTLGTAVNDENAEDLLGEYSSTSSTTTVEWTQKGYNNGPTALGFYYPQGIALDTVNHDLYISDTDNNRVLMYDLNSDNSISTSSGGHTADYVIGQTSLEGPNTAGFTQSSLDGPQGLAIDTANSRLFVADTVNNRIMVFATPVSSNGANATDILGSATYGSTAGGDTASTLSGPTDVAYDSVNHNLYVADLGNNRVLVYAAASGFTAGENATYALGQTSLTANTTGDTQSTLNAPNSLAYDPTNSRLFVTDQGNNRVLVYSTPIAANGPNATFVLGQSGFTTATTADTQSGMNLPSGIAYDTYNGRLFVADCENSRVLVFNVGPSVIANGKNASYVLGHANFTSTGSNLTQAGLSLCNDTANKMTPVKYDPGSGLLFVTDNNYNRIMIFPAENMPSWPPIMAP
jgi:DNA-binding beta-propeller fold protein YncE